MDANLSGLRLYHRKAVEHRFLRMRRGLLDLVCQLFIYILSNSGWH